MAPMTRKECPVIDLTTTGARLAIALAESAAKDRQINTLTRENKDLRGRLAEAYDYSQDCTKAEYEVAS